jgi:hypothetical protein
MVYFWRKHLVFAEHERFFPYKIAMIEEFVTINTGIKKVWEKFADLSCWHKWNTIVTIVSSGEKGKIAEGTSFTCLILPLAFLVPLKPLAEEVVPCKKIVLSGQRFGIRARHEFLFEGSEDETTVTSREIFAGMPVVLPTWLFLEMRIKKLTGDMLHDLKMAAEI